MIKTEEIRRFLEWMERQALSVCEARMERGRWEGAYDELPFEEVLQRYEESSR